MGRYRGTSFGLLWSLLHPLVMLAVYVFVFKVVFEAKWPGLGSDTDGLGFALALFVGVIVHGILAEAVTKAPTLILANQNLVKKVVFPLDTLVWALMGSALFHASLCLLILFAAHLSSTGMVPMQILWFPVILLPLSMLSLGVAWLLASLGVFLRDVQQVAGVLATVLMFLAPVFYPLSALPEAYRQWLFLNPVTYPTEALRAALFLGQAPQASALLLYSCIALAVMLAGYAVFQRTRRGFADVL